MAEAVNTMDVPTGWGAVRFVLMPVNVNGADGTTDVDDDIG